MNSLRLQDGLSLIFSFIYWIVTVGHMGGDKYYIIVTVVKQNMSTA